MTEAVAQDRNADMLRRFEAGETLAAIGKAYGLTRERVRQIVVKKLGATPAREKVAARRRQIVEAIVAENLSTKKAARRFGYTAAGVRSIASDFGVTLHRDLKSEAPEIVAMAELVRNGMSMHKAAGGDRRVEGLLGEHCKRHGIKPKRLMRWRNFTARRKLVEAMYPLGCTWEEIAEAVSQAEGCEIKPQSLYAWSVKFHAHKSTRYLTRKVERPARLHKAAPRLSQPVEIVTCSTSREAAIANYGRASASAIAAAHGVTRNSIIGHWFRARLAGELA